MTETDKELLQYECFLLDPKGYRWTLFFQAESFSHAEEQCLDFMSGLDSNEQIIKITKDYQNK